MVNSQTARKWDQFDCEVLYRQSMAIVGYGEIGRAAARRAKALGMKIYATRRRPNCSKMIRLWMRASLQNSAPT